MPSDRREGAEVDNEARRGDALRLGADKLRVLVSFRRSHSRYYADAVHIARELPNYRVRGEGRETMHSVAVALVLDDLHLWERVRQLVDIVGGWKYSRISIEGASADRFSDLEREITEVRDCYTRREESGIGGGFCSGKGAPDDEPGCFGCRLVRAVARARHAQPHTHLRWYQFGSLSDDLSQFLVDKEEILRLCKVRTSQHLCTACPAFSWQRVQDDIADLPDVVVLNESSPFEVKYSEIDPSKPLGIKRRQAPDDWGYGIRLGFDGEEEDDDQVERNVPSVRYSDVAAQDAALEEIRNVVELPLTHPEYFREIGIEPQRGVLLYGPPGNGKTLIAKAVATESDAHLEIINGPEILSKWVGQSEENLRRVFGRAKRLEPSVILIDEIDALAPDRDHADHHYEVQLISQLLVLLDGMETRGRVAVIGTTNRIQAIDPAIRRPGRFDYHIQVPLPNAVGRTEILQAHVRKLKATPNIRLAEIAEQTEGFSGADLASLCREAGLAAIRRGMRKDVAPQEIAVSQEDLLEALGALRKKRADLPVDKGR